MYDNYDEYMREILGYPSKYPEERGQKKEETLSDYRQDYQFNRQSDLRRCYPEIYHMLMPMVAKACEELYEPITQNDIMRISYDIYFQFEAEEVQTANRSEPEENSKGLSKQDPIRTENISRNIGKRFDRNLEKSISSKPLPKEEKREEENREEERNVTSRRPQNQTLFDLIRILVLNQILGRPNFPERPPRPRPPRPYPPIQPRSEYWGYDEGWDYPYWQ